MKTKAAIHTIHGHPLTIDELEIPDPRPDQVIVKLFSSGVSGVWAEVSGNWL